MVCWLWRGVRFAFEYPCLDFISRQYPLSDCFHLPHPFFAFLHIALRVVVHPKTHSCRCDANRLDWVHRLFEPDDRKADHGYPFDQRGDRIRDWRRRRKNCESEQILSKVHRAVDEEVETDRWPARDCRPCPQSRGIRIDPHRDHKHESHRAREIEQVKLIEFRAHSRRIRVGGHDLLEEDILRDENQGRPERTNETENVGHGNVERARKHDAKGQRKQGEIRGRGIGHSKEESVCQYSEKGRERLSSAWKRVAEFTLMVCTVLTGTRLIARDPKICPPT